MKNIYYTLLVLILGFNASAQTFTCYVVYNHEKKEIFIDVTPNSQVQKIKNAHLSGSFKETNGWFQNKTNLTKNDFQEIKDDLDEKLDAEAFVFSVVSQITVKNYKFIVSERLLKYKDKIIKTYKKQNGIGVTTNKLQGAVEETLARETLERLFRKENVYPQITIQTSDGTIARLDFLVKTDKGFICYEVKSGNALCTPNQQKAFPIICREGFTIKTDPESARNADKFPQKTLGGKRRNDKIGPTPVRLIDDEGLLLDQNFCDCTR